MTAVICLQTICGLVIRLRLTAGNCGERFALVFTTPASGGLNIRGGAMDDKAFTIEQLRRLVAMRPIIRKILKGPNPDREIIAWVKRGGTAEIIRLDDFRTDRQRDCRPGASGSSP